MFTIFFLLYFQKQKKSYLYRTYIAIGGTVKIKINNKTYSISYDDKYFREKQSREGWYEMLGSMVEILNEGDQWRPWGLSKDLQELRNLGRNL